MLLKGILSGVYVLAHTRKESSKKHKKKILYLFVTFMINK